MSNLIKPVLKMTDSNNSRPRNDGQGENPNKERSFSFNGEGQNSARDFEKFALRNLYAAWQRPTATASTPQTLHPHFMHVIITKHLIYNG